MEIGTTGLRKRVAGIQRQLAFLLITHGRKMHRQTQKPVTREQDLSDEVRSPGKIL